MILSKEMETNSRTRLWSVLGLLIALGVASLAGYAVYCFMAKFGE